jgi:hypothetical protein
MPIRPSESAIVRGVAIRFRLEPAALLSDHHHSDFGKFNRTFAG